MCKPFLISFILCLTNNVLIAQVGNRSKLKDSVDVIKFAKKHSKRFNYKPDASFRISYNEANNKWTYWSNVLTYSRKGLCKGLNGCRIIREVTILIDASSRKYTVQKDTTQTLPNYE
jgi:hypothetical protein